MLSVFKHWLSQARVHDGFCNLVERMDIKPKPYGQGNPPGRPPNPRGKGACLKFESVEDPGCRHPRKRMIQYSRDVDDGNRKAAAYAIRRLRGYGGCLLVEAARPIKQKG
jgi:hypothetical protein